MTDPSTRAVPSHIQVFIAGVSGMIATTIVHPLDLLKVRMQLYPKQCTMKEIMYKIVRCEGVTALYNGLTAGMMRQATSTTTRLAFIYWSFGLYNKKYGYQPPFADKLKLGAIAGIAGALAGNPAELILVRMMASSRRDPCCVHGSNPLKKYNGVFHAIHVIVSTEGLCALWRGGVLAVTRSICVSTIHISCYLKAYQFMLDRQWFPKDENTKLHVLSAAMASFPTAIVTLPLDTLKTRYQIRSDRVSQGLLFRMNYSIFGLFYFWQGFTPYYLRLSIHTLITYFIVQRVANSVYFMTYFAKFKKVKRQR